MAVAEALILVAWIALSWVVVWKLAHPRCITFAAGDWDIFCPTKRHATDARGPVEALPPSVEKLLKTLRRSCVAIPVRSVDIDLLNTPKEFFDTVCRLLRSAQKSVILSALYLGSGPCSRQVVDALEDSMQRWNHAEGGDPEGGREVVLLLDCNRMRHAGNMASLRRILRAQAEKAPRVHLRAFLFQTPSHWHRACSFLPSRAREIIGVQHTKVMVVDGETTMLTGANFSDEYFTNRADRYALFHRNAQMAGFFSTLVSSLSTVSYGARLGEDGRVRLVGPSSGADPVRDVEAAVAVTRKVLQNFASTAGGSFDEGGRGDGPFDSWAFPLLQYGRAKVHHGSFVTHQLLKMAWGPDITVRVTSPYLNADPTYTAAMLENPTTPFSILTSSPSTNGFAGHRGFAGIIPSLYLQLERAFFFMLELHGCGDRIRLWEYAAAQGSYHAKGLWIGHPDAVFVTTVGSSNMGCRSAHKDVEADVVLVTQSAALQGRLAAEWGALSAGANLVSRERWSRDLGRFQPVVALVAQLGKQYL